VVLYSNGSQWVQAPLSSNATVADWLTYHPRLELHLLSRNRQTSFGWLTPAALAGLNADEMASTNVAGDIVVDTSWNYIYYRGSDSLVHVVSWTGTQWAEQRWGPKADVAVVCRWTASRTTFYYKRH